MNTNNKHTVASALVLTMEHSPRGSQDDKILCKHFEFNPKLNIHCLMKIRIIYIHVLYSHLRERNASICSLKIVKLAN